MSCEHSGNSLWKSPEANVEEYKTQEVSLDMLIIYEINSSDGLS